MVSKMRSERMVTGPTNYFVQCAPLPLRERELTEGEAAKLFGRMSCSEKDENCGCCSPWPDDKECGCPQFKKIETPKKRYYETRPHHGGGGVRG